MAVGHRRPPLTGPVSQADAGSSRSRCPHEAPSSFNIGPASSSATSITGNADASAGPDQGGVPCGQSMISGPVRLAQGAADGGG